MHEKEKLEEARYFLRQLQATARHAHSLNPLTWQLSAFLSSARSVLQYALDEARTKPGGKVWYDGTVASDPVIRFFKDKRDMNIHERPVVPGRRVEVSLSAIVRVEDSVAIVVRDRSGNVVQTYSSEDKKAGVDTSPTDPSVEPEVRTVFVFTDWAGTEDLPNLGEAYLRAIEQMVAAGLAAGHITG